MNEEIDDPNLENEVENSRDLTKSILDLELAKKLGLNEVKRKLDSSQFVPPLPEVENQLWKE